MVSKSGQQLSPCVEIDGFMLADISGEEVEKYLLSQKLVTENTKAPEAPINAACPGHGAEAASPTTNILKGKR